MRMRIGNGTFSCLRGTPKKGIPLTAGISLRSLVDCIQISLY